MSFGRLLRHFAASPWKLRRMLPPDALARIEAAVSESEKLHRGEIRFAVEVDLNALQIARGVSPRDRALEVFSRLRVWDTEENTGVLIYILLADRQIEIVADRGIHKKVGDEAWIAIANHIESAFREGRYEDGVLKGLSEVTALLTKHFPARAENRDELSNKPVVL